jgi:hypothetical protein
MALSALDSKVVVTLQTFNYLITFPLCSQVTVSVAGTSFYESPCLEVAVMLNGFQSKGIRAVPKYKNLYCVV